MRFSAKILWALLALALAAALPGASFAQAGPALLKGQTLYVPAYPHVFHGVKRDIQLNTTLMVRNLDPKRAISLTRADYHDSAGQIVTSYVSKPVKIGPLASVRITIDKKTPSGNETGGASFIVAWTSPQPVNPPLVETVNIGTTSSQGISFVSPAVPLNLENGE